MPEQQESDWMDYDEAANFLGLKRKNTLYHLVKKKEIPFVRISERNVIFSRKRLRKWLDDRTHDPDKDQNETP